MFRQYHPDTIFFGRTAQLSALLPSACNKHKKDKSVMPDVYKILPGLVIRRYYCVLRLRSVCNFAKRQVAEFMSGAFSAGEARICRNTQLYFRYTD